MIDTEKILKLYSDQYSMLKISKILHIDARAVKRQLLNNGIEIRDNNAYKKKKVNDDFFSSIETEKQAYILGFIYADGCLTKGNALEISVAEKDIDILIKIRKALNSEHKIGIYACSCGFSKIGNKRASLSIVSKKLHDDLVAKGAVERKTKTLKFPTTDILPKTLYPHFIRGFFDGDGSVYHIKQFNTIGCSFTGTKNMLDNIHDILYEVTGSSAKVRKYSNKDIYDFKVGGRNKVRLFYEYIYKDATIFLGRKKMLFEKYLI